MAASGDYDKLYEMIKNIKFAMMTTVDPKTGVLHSRPMGSIKADFRGDLWFFTRASAPKVSEIETARKVNLSYADPDKQSYVSVSGEAELVRDKTKIDALWSPYLKTWFPEGKDDPDVALLRVTVDQAEYWDSPSSKMVLLYGMAKATLTGKTPDLGENQKLDFH